MSDHIFNVIGTAIAILLLVLAFMAAAGAYRLVTAPIECYQAESGHD